MYLIGVRAKMKEEEILFYVRGSKEKELLQCNMENGVVKKN